MAATYTCTPLGTFMSVMRAAAATHSPASPEVLTINHRLGVCPEFMWATLRSVTAIGAVAGISTSSGKPTLALRSWNASQAIFDGVGVGAGWAAGSPDLATFDIVAFLPFSKIK